MRRALAPLLLFEDDDPEDARAKRNTPPRPPLQPKRKTTSKSTPEGLPVQALTDLPSHLGSPTLDEVSLRGPPDTRFIVTGEPTELVGKAFALL